MNSQLLLADVFGEGMLSHEDRWKKVFMNHIPVMITDKNRILCLPDSGEMFHIGCVGMTGKGKGICGNTMLGFEYWMKNRMCMILNDFQNETFEYSLPNSNKVFDNNLSVINTKSIGYPMVYVYPSHKNLIIKEEEKLFPHCKISLPKRVLIRNVEHFYKLDKAAKYVTAYIDRFIECDSLEEIDETITEILSENFEGKKNKFEEMKFKIKTIFKNLLDEEIAESAHTDAPSFLTVDIEEEGIFGYRNLAIQSLLVSGLIPSIQTSSIRGKSWFSAYMSFIIESVYDDFLFRDEEFLRGKNLSMYVPEVDKMFKKGNISDLTMKSLSLLGTNGRRAGIGLRWDAQDYEAVPSAITDNTKILFVMRQKDSDEVRKLKKDFSFDKPVQEQILSLESDPSKGKFECVALSTEPLLLYSPRDGSMVKTAFPQKGRLITPLAQHKVPNIPLKKLISQ